MSLKASHLADARVVGTARVLAPVKLAAARIAVARTTQQQCTSSLSLQCRSRCTHVAYAKSRKQSKGSGADARRAPSDVDGPDDEEEWDVPLSADFPAVKFGDEDEEVEEFDAEDDVLGDAFRLGRRPRSIEDDDEDQEEDEDEDGEGEADADVDEFEAISPDEIVTDDEMAMVDLPYEVENLDYASAVKQRDRKLRSEAEIVPLTKEEVKAAEAVEAAAIAAKAAVIPDDAQLTLNRQGYQAFQMDGVDFLVAELPDGRIDLSDSFYYDSGIEMYARPKTDGALPAGPKHLQVIPWVERRTPDSLKGKEGMAKMKKVYMVGVAVPEPQYRVQMDEVYCFQASNKTLSRCTVTTIGTPAEPVLRIRADGITIEDAIEAPNPSEVSLGSWFQPTDAQREQALQQRIEELEAQAEQMDELDDVPDVPMSDMM